MFHRLQETLRVTMSKSDVVAKYAEVCSTENWGPTVPQMDELVAIYPQSYYELLPEMQRALDNRAVSWIRCFKTMLIIDHFARNLDQRFMDDLRGFSTTISAIENFHYTDSKGIDRGISVRERAKKVNALLRDASFLDAEREKESRTRDKVTGGGGGAGGKYQGFGSGAAQGGGGASSAHHAGGMASSGRYGGIASSSVAGARLHGANGDTGASGAHIEKTQAQRDHELAMQLQAEFDREARGGPPTGMHHGGGGHGLHQPQQGGVVYRGGGATITTHGGSGGAGRYGGMGSSASGAPRYGDSDLPPTAFQEQQQQLEIQLQAMQLGKASGTQGGSARPPSGAAAMDEDYKLALALAGDTPQVFHSAPRAAVVAAPQQPRAPVAVAAAVAQPAPAPVAVVPAVVVARPAPSAVAPAPDLFGGFTAAPAVAPAPAPKPASTLDDIFGGPTKPTSSATTSSAGGAGFGDFFSAAPASASASTDIFAAAPRPAAAAGPPAFGNNGTGGGASSSYQRDAFASLAATTTKLATTSGPTTAPMTSTNAAAARPPADDGWPF
jgi:hypothetical protein